MLERKDFRDFFAALHKGNAPYDWQERLLDELLDTGVWPDRVVAPTGAGKTSAIDVHVFAVALNAADLTVRVPRRLAMVVGRRVLVDDQYEYAKWLRQQLKISEDPAVRTVAAQLATLRRMDKDGVADLTGTSDTAPVNDESPLVVARLRGGAAPSREWRDHPTACAIICGTPDMWGSRLLFRGYGSAPRARPREAGLLAMDAAVVVDEAHLSRQLLATARRVGQLAAVADEPIPVPALQVVETTATPVDVDGDDPDAATFHGREVGVTENDLVTSELLQQRLCRPKPVTLVPEKAWPADTAPKRKKVAKRLADLTVSLLAEPPTEDTQPAHTVGCYVNTVPMAIATANALRASKKADGTPVRVVMVCGQSRPADLDRLRSTYKGILDDNGNRNVDVLVSTQSLEVGVDLDLAAVATELAPASALVQRAGRVNRRGIRSTGPVHVLVPEGELTGKHRSGPYEHDELNAALAWLRERSADPAGMAPWSIRTHRPPAAKPRRTLFQRPELADAWHWARTSDELAAEPQLDLWLSDSFEEESTVELVVRDAMPPDAADAVRLVTALRPRDHEAFSVSITAARDLVDELISESAAANVDETDAVPAIVLVRGDDVVVLDDAEQIRPGDVVVIDSDSRLFTSSSAGDRDGFSPPVPLRRDESVDGRRDCAADVFHAPEPVAGQAHLRLEPAVWPEQPWAETVLKEYAEAAGELSEGKRRKLLRTLLRDRVDLAQAPAIVSAVEQLLALVRNCDVELHTVADVPVRLVVVDRRRAVADDEVRQTWLPNEEPVRLDAHQEAVAARAALVGDSVGLPLPLVTVLQLAGRHHDDGKVDPRFQAVLGGPQGDEPVAKSGGSSLAEFRRRAAAAALPARWRHEQYSVVAGWANAHEATSPHYVPLVARLVGTSHGYGRAGFPHTAADLLHHDVPQTQRDLAVDLFDLGGWDELIERTHARWGVWGCAYLEALLRAADGQVSREERSDRVRAGA